MSEDDFLARWSRRKRAAAKGVRQEPQPAPEPAAERAPVSAETAVTRPNQEEPAAEEVDLSSLPSLDSITASTDVTGFLRRGVPDELKRSALRKAWTSDPAIRDFVGLAENAWDFNDPTAMPGFGPLDWSPEQVRQMAAKLVGGVQQASEQIERAIGATAPQHQPAPERQRTESGTSEAHVAAPAVSQNEVAASQHEEQNSPSQPPRARRHGGALPS